MYSDVKESSPAEQTLLEAWVPLAASFLGICTAFSMSAMIGPMLVPLGSEFGMSVPALGLYSSIDHGDHHISYSLRSNSCGYFIMLLHNVTS